MALPTSDGRSLCLASNCQRISADFPRRFTLVPGLKTISPQVREILALLTSNHSDDVWCPVYEIRAINVLDVSGEGGAKRAAAAVAQGNAHVLIDHVEVLLAHGKYAFNTMRISYFPDELNAAKLELIENCSDVVLELVDKLGALEKKAVLELASRGFKVAITDFTSAQRRVLMFKGPSVQTGLKIELTWIAD